MEFAGNATPLTPKDLQTAVDVLGCELAVVQAVCDVESAGGGFLPDNRPKILFESHQFHNLTDGQYDDSNPDVSTPTWEHNYGAPGAHQYDRLAKAIDLDRSAALQSASWGRFQVMGTNYNMVGWADVESFVRDMCDSEYQHLRAFVGFCQANHIVGALVNHDWATFARHYNGPGQVDVYAAKLAQAYVRHA